MKLGARYMALIFVVLSTAAASMVAVSAYHLRQQDLKDAEARARLILDHNLAIHTYFSHQLKPSVFKALEGRVAEDYFEPAWMSSTWAVRGITQYFDKLSETGYYYKEAAINARNPLNEADPFEREFLQRLNRDHDLVQESEARNLDGELYYVVLRRGETMEMTCLRCHSEPANAPSGLVEQFGGERSFNRSEGEVVSAISIRIPLQQAYAASVSKIVILSASFILLLAVAGLVMAQQNRRLFAAPLHRFQGLTRSIAQDQKNVGAQLPLEFPGEWSELARDFNAMSSKLKETYDGLEDQVTRRTADLEKALVEVKRLSGMLPICANCKKIRDDQGYWNQIEHYLAQHSQATFTHGICPDCAAQLYPEVCQPPPKKNAE